MAIKFGACASAISSRSPPSLFAVPPALPLYFEGVASCMDAGALELSMHIGSGVSCEVVSFGRWRVWCLHALCVLVVLGCGADMCLPGRPPC